MQRSKTGNTAGWVRQISCDLLQPWRVRDLLQLTGCAFFPDLRRRLLTHVNHNDLNPNAAYYVGCMQLVTAARGVKILHCSSELRNYYNSFPSQAIEYAHKRLVAAGNVLQNASLSAYSTSTIACHSVTIP